MVARLFSTGNHQRIINKFDNFLYIVLVDAHLDKGKLPTDPWGNEFVYLSPGVNGEYDLMSYGADGVQGGEGKNQDINNWEIE